jgi:hypothetical protein
MREHIKLMEKLSEMVNVVDSRLEGLSHAQMEAIRQKVGEIMGVVERRKRS